MSHPYGILQTLPDGIVNPEWVRARQGCLSASRIADILIPGKKKGEPSVTRKKYATSLAVEQLAVASNNNVNPKWEDVKRGLEHEPLGVNEYEAMTGVLGVPAAWCEHPSIEYAGATPDLFIGDHGLVQIKCPRPENMFGIIAEYESTKQFPKQYEPQMMWEMAVTGRQWNDLAVYCDVMPEGKKLWVRRLYRDAERIAFMEEQAALFMKEVDHMFEVVSTAQFIEDEENV